MNNSDRNGGRLVWWLMSLLATIVLSLTGAWAVSVETAKTKFQEADQRQSDQISDLRRQLDLANMKLDMILEELDRRAKP